MGMIKLEVLKQEANSNGMKGDYRYVKYTTKNGMLVWTSRDPVEQTDQCSSFSL